ncbi:MAG: hypothetical protein JWR01_2358 [Subtercola sp.]|nr:hypothetical protein [Subtercola sp.]
MTTKDTYFDYDIHYRDDRGRVLVANSLTSFESDDHRDDVVLGGSFAGRPTGVLPVRQGARGWIAHEAGPGLDDAGVAGLAVSDRFGVPAAAIGTFTSRIASGTGLLAGTVSRVNESAARNGVRVGMTGDDAALHMLDAPRGSFRDVTGLVDESTVEIEVGERGGIYSCWSSSRVSGRHPHDVFLLASHGARTMALYVLEIAPRGVIVSDGGMALDRSGVEGLPILAENGVAAAAVSAATARIGDPTSTAGGTISAVNEVAFALGVREGQPALAAARIMLDGE